MRCYTTVLLWTSKFGQRASLFFCFYSFEKQSKGGATTSRPVVHGFMLVSLSAWHAMHPSLTLMSASSIYPVSPSEPEPFRLGPRCFHVPWPAHTAACFSMTCTPYFIS
uniref:Uncharacterized protein n=1 Tax=Arundo donax TaxID=35708 RepID=A0A0A9CE66_ARUDO